jgi:hypothetical protein
MMIGRILKRMKYKYGAERYRQMLFDKIVQQSLSKTREKRLNNLNSDKSLEGLVVDWHLANTEMGFDNFVEPVQNDQPTYAYA